MKYTFPSPGPLRNRPRVAVTRCSIPSVLPGLRVERTALHRRLICSNFVLAHGISQETRGAQGCVLLSHPSPSHSGGSMQVRPHTPRWRRTSGRWPTRTIAARCWCQIRVTVDTASDLGWTLGCAHYVVTSTSCLPPSLLFDVTVLTDRPQHPKPPQPSVPQHHGERGRKRRFS